MFLEKQNKIAAELSGHNIQMVYFFILLLGQGPRKPPLFLQVPDPASLTALCTLRRSGHLHVYLGYRGSYTWYLSRESPLKDPSPIRLHCTASGPHSQMRSAADDMAPLGRSTPVRLGCFRSYSLHTQPGPAGFCAAGPPGCCSRAGTACGDACGSDAGQARGILFGLPCVLLEWQPRRGWVAKKESRHLHHSITTPA